MVCMPPVLFFLVFYLLQCSGKEITEADLITDILGNYNTAARPRINPLEQVSVTVGFYLTRLDGTDLRNNKLTSTGWLGVEWTDDFLRWNASSYSNITKVIIPSAKVWKPDIAIDNSADEVYSSLYNSAFQVVLHNDGSMLWEPGGSFSTICYFDITSYPFDHQTCEIVLASWHYTIDMMNFTSSGEVNTESYSLNGEWEIEYTKLFIREWTQSQIPSDIYPEVVVELHIRRKTLYYVINVIIPCFLMSLLVLMVFHLPPDSGEKVSLGVTVLLAFSVFQLMIAESVPSSSDTTPMLGIYLLFFMVESTFSVAISVIVLNLHHRTEYKPPPDWLKRLVLYWMAKMLFMRVQNPSSVHVTKNIAHASLEHVHSDADIHVQRHDSEMLDSFHIHKDQHSHPKLVIPTISVQGENSLETDIKDHQNAHSNTNIHTDAHHLLSPNSSTHITKDTTMNLSPSVAKSAMRIMKSIANLDHIPSNQSRIEFMNLIKDTYRDLCQQRQDDEMEQMFENEWKRIAKVVDKFFFVVTLSFIIISSTVIFSAIPYSHS